MKALLVGGVADGKLMDIVKQSRFVSIPVAHNWAVTWGEPGISCEIAQATYEFEGIELTMTHGLHAVYRFKRS